MQAEKNKLRAISVRSCDAIFVLCSQGFTVIKNHNLRDSFIFNSIAKTK